MLEEFKGVANVTELMIRRRMAEKVEPPGGNWSQFTEKTHGVDALGRTKAQVDASEMPDIHGHHIKCKKALSESDLEAQDLLMEYNIDPMFGKEMLVFAPNKGHPHSINIDVGDSIKKTVIESKRRGLSKAETRSQLVTTLQEKAEEYIESRWPGYIKQYSIFN